MSDYMKFSPIGAFSFHWNQGIHSNNSCFVRVGKSVVAFLKVVFCEYTISKITVAPVFNNGNHKKSIFFKECEKEMEAFSVEKVNEKNAQDSERLLDSAKFGDEESLKMLLKDGNASINNADKLGFTPLHWAANNGHVGCLNILLKEGARVDVADDLGIMPLHCAIKGRHKECLAVLLGVNAGADLVNQHCGLVLLTPLSLAAMNGSAECVKLLLSTKGIYVNVVTKYGDTALHLACIGHTEVVNALLTDADIDVNLINGNNAFKTPLAVTISQAAFGCFEALLADKKKRIDVNKKSGAGMTPLHDVVMMGLRSLEFLKKLLEQDGILLNITNNDGLTPLDCARKINNKECVDLLEEFGKDKDEVI